MRFLDAVSGTRKTPFLSEAMTREMVALPPAPVKPRPNGTHPGLGWDQVRLTAKGATYQKNGGLLGVHALIQHRSDGVDWAFTCNGGRAGEEGADGASVLARAARAIEDEMAAIETWPSVDLYERSPGGSRP